jgi:hypothetical protein
MVQMQAFLVANQFKSFPDRKTGGKVEYYELTFLTEDTDGLSKILVLRGQKPDIADMKVIFKDVIKGKFPYGELTYDYKELSYTDGVSGGRKTAYKPKYVSFKV